MPNAAWRGGGTGCRRWDSLTLRSLSPRPAQLRKLSSLRSPGRRVERTTP
jgi:hypothetical protein